MNETIKKYFMQDFIIAITSNYFEDADTPFYVSIYKDYGNRTENITNYFNSDSGGIIQMNDLSELYEIFKVLEFYQKYMWKAMVELEKIKKEEVYKLIWFINNLQVKHPEYHIEIIHIMIDNKIELEVYVKPSYKITIVTEYQPTKLNRVIDILEHAFSYVE